MLDVIHVFYEEDITPRHEQDIEIKDRVRSQLYPILYKRPYRFASTSSAQMRSFGGGSEDRSRMPDLPEIPVESREVKPYIPPTPIEDLPGILDAPLN